MDPVIDTATAITVRGLHKTYGSFTAVEDVDLTVATGEIFAILGPNGAGKTTTVEIMEGYRARDRGTVDVLGIDPAKATADWRARVGIVLQTSGFTDELTVREILTHFASFYASPRDIDGLLAAVGLTEKQSSRAHSLSGGQQRRLDVAVGVVGRPELLFLDEPTTGFDPEARHQFWDLIRSLRDDGTTIVLTTHYLDEAEALADRLAVLVAGRVVEVATPATLGGRSGAASSVRWVEGDETKEIVTETPTKVVAELSARLGGEIPELRVARPSLEDVYLAMVAVQR